MADPNNVFVVAWDWWKDVFSNQSPGTSNQARIQTDIRQQLAAASGVSRNTQDLTAQQRFNNAINLSNREQGALQKLQSADFDWRTLVLFGFGIVAFVALWKRR